MKYSIPTDFSDSLLKSIDSEHVGELYGKLPRDFVGGGRPSFILPSVTKKKFIAHVKKCREHGIDFNYLLNSTCIGNRELTRSGSRKLKKLLDMLIKAKVSTVTVSIPYILEYVKRNYPELKVSVSVMAGVDSPEKARYWESLGADRITLPSVCGLYRNFPLLRQIRNAVSCELKLIANLTCLHRCPLWMYHASGHSHASQTGDPSRGFVIDYAYLRCNSLKLENPVEFIRANWIRPEDVSLYEKEGINMMKFANRGLTAERLADLLNTYINEKFDGNLLELFSNRSEHYGLKKYRDILKKIHYLFKPFKVNVFKLLRLKDLLIDNGIYIDNRKLDGFINYFLTDGCGELACEECDYCDKIAEKVMSIDEEKRLIALEEHGKCLESLFSGDMFSYFGRGRPRP